MSTIADHGYIPEEHAPDPVISHGDPTMPGKVAIWLFLASEIMFFIGILGSYIILRSGAPVLFAEHAASLSKSLAAVNTLVLIFSSLTVALAVDAAQKGNRTRTAVCLAITLVCAFGFMGIKTVEYYQKFTHYTVVAVEKVPDPTGKSKKMVEVGWVYDGHWHEHDGKKEFVGYRMLIPDQGFDLHLISETEIKRAAAEAGMKEPQTFDMSGLTIGAEMNYGPWRNIFYSCYYALTGIHGLHVVGGIIPIGILLIQTLRGKLYANHIEYTGLYWHFVDLVWIFLFPLLYLI